MRFPKKVLSSTILSLLAAPVGSGVSIPPGGPDEAAGAMYGLDDIYHRLRTGAEGEKRGATFQGPSLGPGEATFVTLDDIMSAAPRGDNESGAAAADVRDGRVFWGLRQGAEWGLAQGSMPEHVELVLTPGVDEQTIPQGYHDGSGRVAGDAELIAENVRRDVEIFGVSGSLAPPTGDALPSQVLMGTTFSSADGSFAGLMPDHGAKTLFPGAEPVAIEEGYHDGNGIVIGDEDLAPENIAVNVNLFGVEGSLVPPTGNALPSQVLVGTTFSTASGSYAGVMADNGAMALFPSTQPVYIREGYHNGNGIVVGDADLTPANIAYNVNLFGVTGTLVRASGVAAPAQVLSGVSFSNADGAASGAMPNRGGLNLTPDFSSGEPAIPRGYYDGSGVIEGDPELIQGNIRRGVELFGVAGSPTVVDTASANARASDIREGRVAWVDGLEVSGTLATKVLSASTTVVAEGVYETDRLEDVDGDLNSSNIRAGVAIFGIPGSLSVVDTRDATATGDDLVEGETAYVGGAQIHGVRPPAPLTQTGQNACHDQYGGSMTCLGTGQDGEYRAGVESPVPRFSARADGTVRDNRTGLVWLRNADCFGVMDWVNGLLSAMYLESGDCGLNDGSEVGDWRIPNVRELESLIDYRYAYPALANSFGNGQFSPGDPFYNVRDYQYWTSTTLASSRHEARVIRFGGDGSSSRAAKTYYGYVWPVRDGYWTDTDWMTSGDYPSSSY